MAINRRTFLATSFSVAAAVGVAGCSTNSTSASQESLAEAIRRVEAQRFSSGKTSNFKVTQQLAEVDLGFGSTVTKTFDGSLPGTPIRVKVGDLVKFEQTNELSEATSVHFHGLSLRNDADGVPMLTQDAVPSGSSFIQQFKAPHAGTYWYHAHSGLQLEEGLYGSFIIEDPNEKTNYDSEWVLLLDDWMIGQGQTPQQALEKLTAQTSGNDSDAHSGHSSSGMDMGNMGMGGMSHDADLFGLGLGSGDVTYPSMLINGRVASNPEVRHVAPGKKIRLRVINAASDTTFVFGVGSHDLEITHTDGFAVESTKAKTVLIGMGERVDAIVTVRDGSFPIFAHPLSGKTGPALAVVKSSNQRVDLRELKAPGIAEIVAGGITELASLKAAAELNLLDKPATTFEAMLMGQMSPYSWNINGQKDMHGTIFELLEGETVDVTFMNHTMMSHPMHLHGHTFQVVKAGNQAIQGGARKDTVLVRPMSSMTVRIKADNPGDWAVHCHNSYHMETGMMAAIRYKL